MSFGDNLKTLRRKKGWKKSDLAKKCGVSKKTVSKWENEESIPSIEELKRISLIFNITVDELIQNQKMIDQKREELFKPFWFTLGWRIRDRYGYENKYKSAWQKATEEIDTEDMLYWIARARFIDLNDCVYEKYFLKNSNKKERANWVEYINGGFGNDKTGYFDDYINGKCEIDEIFKNIEKEFSQRRTELQLELELKREHEIYRNYKKMIMIAGMMSAHEMFSDKKLEELRKDLEKIIDKQDQQTVIGKFFIFYGTEIKKAFKKKDVEILKNLQNDLQMMENYVWNKIPQEDRDQSE